MRPLHLSVLFLLGATSVAFAQPPGAGPAMDGARVAAATGVTHAAPTAHVAQASVVPRAAVTPSRAPALATPPKASPPAKVSLAPRPGPAQKTPQASTPAAHPLVGRIMPEASTGVGNRFRVAVEALGTNTDGAGATREAALSLSYTDSSGYMARGNGGRAPDSVRAFVRVRIVRTGSAPSSWEETRDGTVTLTRQADGQYLVTDDPTRILAVTTGSTLVSNAGRTTTINSHLSAVDVAFAGPNETWDSNAGANYRQSFTSP